MSEVSYTMLLDQSKVAKMLEDGMPAWYRAWEHICHALGWDKNELPEQLDVGPLLYLSPQMVPMYVHTFLMDYIRSFRDWAIIFGEIFEVCLLALSLYMCSVLLQQTT
jgi:hypothetical protein